MHFRDRGNSVQLVRTTYNADTKKPSTEVVGRLDRPGFAIDDELKGKLTPEELQEVTSYGKRASRKETVATDHAVTQFPATLKMVSDWLASADADDAAAFAEEVQKPLAKLRRGLAKGAEGDSIERREKVAARKSAKAASPAA